MTNKTIFLVMLATVLTFGLVLAGCDDTNTEKNLKYSVQVNNQQATRSISAEDTVELYILNMEYVEDVQPWVLVLIANNDRDQGSKGGKLNNAGWYSVKADLAVANDVNNGPYSGFAIRISQLKVNETVYNFPQRDRDGEVLLGNSPRMQDNSEYPNNFPGITITDSTSSLKTILTVEPGIIGTPSTTGYDSQGLATDPYKYIKIEGRINE